MQFNLVSYHLWPPVWICEALGRDPDGNFDVTRLGDVMQERSLDAGIRIEARRQGLFTFDFGTWEPPHPTTAASRSQAAHYSQARTDVINAYLACLYSSLEDFQPPRSPLPGAGHRKMWVTTNDLALRQRDRPNEASLGDTQVLAFLRSDRPDSYSGPAGKDWRHIGRWLVIEPSTLEVSFDKLHAILESDIPDLLSVVAIYNQACVSYESESYGPALALAWTITEKMLGVLWTRYISANRDRPVAGSPGTLLNSDRERFLQDGKNFPASVIAEVLSLADYLPFAQYRAIRGPRKHRNKWLHQMEPISAEWAAGAISAAENLMEFVTAIRLHVRLVGFPRG